MTPHRQSLPLLPVSMASLYLKRSTRTDQGHKNIFSERTLPLSMTPEPLEYLRAHWASLLASPQWYLRIIPEMQALAGQLKNSPPETQRQYKTGIYDFFEEHLI